VPRSMIPQAKRGFAVPLGAWLRGSWRELVEQTLFSSNAAIDGLFDRAALRRYWDDHLEQRADHKWGIWTILALVWWRKRVRASART